MKTPQQINPFNLKVFVEDTDFQGFVYHANYLKFFERARSQFLNDIGILQSTDSKGFFVVKDVYLKYIKPAKLEDELLIKSEVVKISKARCVFVQDLIREDTVLAKAKVEICYIDSRQGKPVGFPQPFLNRI
ncbi:MAG: YbgC/FadM family acyl-CoA thioesterase [Gammaproteobacteria bacterium]